MNDFNIIVKGKRYILRAYKEYRNEWDLSVDGKMLCDSKPYHQCISNFLQEIKD